MKILKRLGILAVVLLLLSVISVSAFALEPRDTVEKHGVTTISGNAKHVYEKLVEQVYCETPADEIEFELSLNITVDEMKKGVSIFLSDYPECFWMTNDYGYTHSGDYVSKITPNYSFAGDDLFNAADMLANAVEDIMSTMTATTNYDKALWLHDALASRVTYEETGEHQTAYGALVNGKAVCAGYAAAYQLLLNMAGINAWTVTGTSIDPSTGNPIGHAWNVVWLDSDTCVYTDVTWDDQGSDIFHNYFNLSKDEMEADHTTDSEIFTLLDCNHTESSYFDVSGHTASDTSTVNMIASMFGKPNSGVRKAEIYYNGSSSFNTWLSLNITQLYSALGGSHGSFSYSTSSIGNEIHLFIEGSFPTDYYTVSIKAPEGMTTRFSKTQEVIAGNHMYDVVYTADTGYYFPEDYFTGLINGIYVTRISSNQITLSGIPVSDVDIELPAPSEKAIMPTPYATFQAEGFDSGYLHGLDTAWKISFDDGYSWLDIYNSTVHISGGLFDGIEIYILNPSNDPNISDSELFIIEVDRALFPETDFETVIPSAWGGDDGKIIGVTSEMEYRTESDDTYLPCPDGELSGLISGTYYLRIKANGSALASADYAVEVRPYGSVTDVIINGELILYVGEYLTPEYVVLPDYAYDKGLTFGVSDDTILSINPTTGELYGISTGTVTITATADDGGIFASATVTVKCNHANRSFVDGKIATCVDAGWDEHFHCPDCGYYISYDGTVEYEEYPTYLNPDYHENISTIPAVEATCSTPGHDEYTKCIGCGEILSGSNNMIFVSHNFSDWKVIKHATSTEEGLKERVCICGKTEVQTIPKTNSDSGSIIGSEGKTMTAITAVLALLLLIFYMVKINKNKF